MKAGHLYSLIEQTTVKWQDISFGFIEEKAVKIRITLTSDLQEKRIKGSLCEMKTPAK